AGSTLVVADQAELRRQPREQRRPHRTLPVELDVVHPIRGLDHGQAVSAHRDREIDALRGAAEAHLLGGRTIRLAGWPRGRLLAHLADEPEAAAGHRAYEALLFPAVADGMPRGGDPAGQRGLRDDPSPPDRRQQIILARDAIPVLDQIRQEIEYLWFDLDQLGAAPQLAPLEVERVVAEQKAHPGAPNPAPHTTPRLKPARPQAKIATISGINQDYFKVGRQRVCHLGTKPTARGLRTGIGAAAKRRLWSTRRRRSIGHDPGTQPSRTGFRSRHDAGPHSLS